MNDASAVGETDDHPDAGVGDDGLGPFIYWASQPVAPDETILVTGGTFTDDGAVELSLLADDDPGNPLTAKVSVPLWTPVSPLRRSSSSLAVVVPGSLKSGVYGIRVSAHGRPGKTALVNAPDLWFVQGDLGETASPGGSLRVFGTALDIPGGAGPKAALVQNGAVVRYLEASAGATGYALTFPVPADVPPGDYSLYVHNGHGGPSAWTRFSTFASAPVTTVSIANPPAWPTQVVTVAAASGADDQSFAAAFAQATANGGGVVSIPAGTYTLKEPLVVPNHTLLKGAGKTATILKWSADPATPLIAGVTLVGGKPERGTFSLEDLAVVATPTYRTTAIERHFTSEPGHFRRIACSVPSVDNSNRAVGRAITLRATANFELTECDLEARVAVGVSAGVSFLRIENNNISWRDVTVALSGSRNVIVANNTMKLLGNATINKYGTNANPGFAFAANEGPFARDLYYGENTTTREEPGNAESYVGITFDGLDGRYFGYVASVSGTTMTLKSPTQPLVNGRVDAGGPANAWAGALVTVMSGAGAGQWRHLVSNELGTPMVEVDRPWDVAPDATSVVSICAMHGRALFVGNDYAQDPVTQAYYMALDVIQANNKVGVDGTNAILSALGGAHNHGVTPAWHFQVLGNQLIRGTPTLGTYAPTLAYRNDPRGTNSNAWYTGPVTAYQVFRNNEALPSLTNSSLDVGGGPFSDLLVEGNRLTSLGFRVIPNIKDTVLRKNVDPTTGQASKGPVDAGPGILVLP